VADGAAGFVLTKSGAGTLSIDHTSATPANFAATTIDLAAGTLQSTGALVLDGDLDVTGSGVTVKSVAGQFKIDGGTAIGDGNTLNVSGDVHLGSVTIAAGESATIVAAAASDVVEINTLAVGDGSGLTVTGPGGSYNSTGSVQIAPNSTVTFNSTAASYSGGNLQSAGADTLNFSGSQSYASLVRAGASLDLALAAGTKVTVGTYNDATQAGDVNISGAGGSFVIDTVAGGGVTAADTTVNVAAGATFEALGDQGAGGPLGSGGAVAVNLAGGTARFSLGGGTLQSPVQMHTPSTFQTALRSPLGKISLATIVTSAPIREPRITWPTQAADIRQSLSLTVKISTWTLPTTTTTKRSISSFRPLSMRPGVQAIGVLRSGSRILAMASASGCSKTTRNVSGAMATNCPPRFLIMVT
jgi:hypothetical protein